MTELRPRSTLERVICPDCGDWVLRFVWHENGDPDRFKFLFEYDRETGKETGHHPCSIKRAAVRYARD